MNTGKQLAYGTPAVFVVTATCVALAVAPGCSGSPASSSVSCGPGTALVNGQCVPSAASDGGADAASGGDAEAGSSQGGSDGGPTDASGESSRSDVSTQSADASDANPLGDSDPCPDSSLPPLVVDCSGQCPVPDGGSHVSCDGRFLCPTYTVYQTGAVAGTALPPKVL